MGDEVANEEKVGPRLAVTGSKVSRKWLDQWLINPKNYLPQGKMPQFGLRPQAADALAAYLMTFRDQAIDGLAEKAGDHDAGATIFRQSQCITCHVTREDTRGNPVGGTIGPDLRKLGNKVSKRWLLAFFKDPHAFYPHTKMPRFYFSDQEVADLAQYAIEEWVDLDLAEAEKKEPAAPPDSPPLIAMGNRLFGELSCAGCHDLTNKQVRPAGPDLTFIGSKPVHDLDFGEAKVNRTLPDFLFTKLKSPKSLGTRFRLHLGEDAASACGRTCSRRQCFRNLRHCRRVRMAIAWRGFWPAPRTGEFCPGRQSSLPARRRGRRPGWSKRSTRPARSTL